PGLVPLGSLKGEPGLFAAWPGVVSPKSWQDWLGGPGGPGGLSAQAGPARPNPNTSTVDATITLRRITIASISKGSDSEAPDPPPGGKVRPHMCGNDVPAAGGEPILASSQARPAPDNRAGHFLHHNRSVNDSVLPLGTPLPHDCGCNFRLNLRTYPQPFASAGDDKLPAGPLWGIGSAT